uniref:Uncharacterized protein n=1 Tax=Nelumbo nucifera TaxID=4432 RepID=A0A822Z2H1_NELNU|nr:TPA_asm: hypothetical protein HUJ06_006328 [Nelumbo nucifera]
MSRMFEIGSGVKSVRKALGKGRVWCQLQASLNKQSSSELGGHSPPVKSNKERTLRFLALRSLREENKVRLGAERTAVKKFSQFFTQSAHHVCLIRTGF